MLKDYYNEFPLLNKRESSEEQIDAERSAVFARIETEGKAMKKTSDNNFSYIEHTEPQTLYPRKTSPWKRIVPAAAAAAVIAAAIPVSSGILKKRAETADSSGIEYSSAASASPASSPTNEAAAINKAPAAAPRFADIPIEYRYDKETEGQGETTVSTVNINGRIYAASEPGCVPLYDKDGAMLKHLKEMYGIDESVTYEELRALPSIGKGRMFNGLALNDFRVSAQWDERYYCEADFCQYSDDILIMRCKANLDGNLDASAVLSDLDAVPDEEINYCFLSFSERQTKAAEAANKLYDEWKSVNKYGIVKLTEVLNTGVDEKKLFTEVTLCSNSDKDKFAEYLNELGVAPENVNIVVKEAARTEDLPTEEIIKKLRQERRPMRYFLFNGVEYDINENGRIFDNGEYEEIEYDNVFQAQGLRVNFDENGGFIITETNENPDVYYFEIEVWEKNFPDDMISCVFNEKGEVRVVLGNEALYVHAADTEEGWTHWFFNEYEIDWEEKSDEDQLSEWLFGGGGIDVNKDGYWDGSLGRKIYKTWYIVNGDLENKFYRNPVTGEIENGEHDIFRCSDGSYSYFWSRRFDDFVEAQYGAYGAVNPFKNMHKNDKRESKTVIY